MSDLMMNTQTYANTTYPDLYVRFHGEYQITMSDLMMNVHTCVTDDTTYTMFYVRPLCLN